jgi:2-keto-4-pentenoate hydratase
MTDITTAARLLLDARTTGAPLAELPPHAEPQTLAEAYAIQDAQIGALGGIGGWKVGARAPDAEPMCAPLPRALVLASPQTFAPTRFPLHLVEAEIAFTLARDLPPRSAPYTIDEAAGAIASVHAVIEVVASRYVDWRARSALAQLADFQNNGALVLSAGRTSDVRVDQRALAVRVDVAEAPALQVTGGNAAGDVLRLLAWLANHAAARCGGLRAGDVVTTGSCIGAYAVAPQSRVRATFDGIPPVEATV